MKFSWGLGIAALVAVGLTTLAPAARADEPAKNAADLGPDEITLKNGGLVRGTIVELEPGQHVTLQVVGGGKPRVIAWTEVADVERGKYAPKAAPKDAQPGPAGPGYGSPAPAVDATPSTDQPGVVRFHIDADKPGVELHEQKAAGVVVGPYGAAVIGIEQVVCTAPCDRVVDGSDGHPYFFAGEGVPPAGPFRLVGYRGDVSARVQVGSPGLRIGGSWMMAVGAAGVATGAVLLILGATLHSIETDPVTGLDQTGGSNKTMLIAGGATLGGSAALLGGGIAMFVVGKTKYELGAGEHKQAVAPRYWLGEF